MPGPDHIASLDLIEFKEMCNAIRNVEKMLGNGIKKIEKCEEKNLKIARKSIVAKKNITAKRPFDGISPENLDYYLSKKSKFNYKKDQKIV